ncbi:MAG: mycothiol synthase [Actinomycetes bacterium]
MSGPPDVDVHDRLPAADAAAVREIALQATDADGVPPLSEHVLLHLRHGGDASGRHLLVRQEGRVIGYAHLDETDPVEGGSAELVVAPAARGRGVGRELLSALLAQTASPHRLRLWAHGEQSGAVELARGAGFVEMRRLVQLRRSLRTPLPAVAVPAGVRVSTFRVGQDEEAWLALNARAFQWHPEQGRWDLTDLAAREAEPWFDPAGFFLAWSQDQLVGFHWTKVHGGFPSDAQEGAGQRAAEAVTQQPSLHGHDVLGEVYVVGVDPEARGRGLARALTLLGLHHLRAVGVDEVMLYAEADNTAALRLYEGLGFVRHDVDRMFRSPGRATMPS